MGICYPIHIIICTLLTEIPILTNDFTWKSEVTSISIYVAIAMFHAFSSTETEL